VVAEYVLEDVATTPIVCFVMAEVVPPTLVTVAFQSWFPAVDGAVALTLKVRVSPLRSWSPRTEVVPGVFAVAVRVVPETPTVQCWPLLPSTLVPLGNERLVKPVRVVEKPIMLSALAVVAFPFVDVRPMTKVVVE